MTIRREILKDIGDMIKNAVGPGICFVLFLESDGQIDYLSNGDRDDVTKALEEWLEKTSGRLDVEKIPETSVRVDSRLTLESSCARIGRTLGQAAKLGLMLFSFGENGSAAYFTNMPGFRALVEKRVQQHRGVS